MKRKFLIIMCFFSMFFCNFNVVNAKEEKEISVPEIIFPKNYDENMKKEYPYYAVQFLNKCVSRNVDFEFGYFFLVSKKPIVLKDDLSIFLDYNFFGSGSSNVGSDIFCPSIPSSFVVADLVTLSRMNRFYSFDNIVLSNHDVKTESGTLVFPVIPDTPENPDIPPSVTPDLSWMENLGDAFLKILIPVIGGMILLMLFFLLLKRLASFFRNFGTS